MIGLILNSGIGSRMGDLTKTHPKCMTELRPGETLLSRQLRQLEAAGLQQVVLTTGFLGDVLGGYLTTAPTHMEITCIHNPDYRKSNYILSIALAAEELQDDVVMLHGDLVFADDLLPNMLADGRSLMAVSSTQPLPQKDFKAVIRDGRIVQVGVDCFDNARAAQPMYVLRKQDWLPWLHHMVAWCDQGKIGVYGEDALPEVTGLQPDGRIPCRIFPYDVKDTLCGEVDTQEDLMAIRQRLAQEAAHGR